MNKQIESLLDQLDSLKADVVGIKGRLQREYDKVFEKDERLAKAISALYESDSFRFNSYGEVEAYHEWYDLVDYKDCREYLESYLHNEGIGVDFDADLLINRLSDEELIIQDDTGRDNGVWQSGKRVIDEKDYLDDDGHVDEAKRNALIEAHMERTGFFPGVFRFGRLQLFAVNTSGGA